MTLLLQLLYQSMVASIELGLDKIIRHMLFVGEYVEFGER